MGTSSIHQVGHHYQLLKEPVSSPWLLNKRSLEEDVYVLSFLLPTYYLTLDSVIYVYHCGNIQIIWDWGLLWIQIYKVRVEFKKVSEDDSFISLKMSSLMKEEATSKLTSVILVVFKIFKISVVYYNKVLLHVHIYQCRFQGLWVTPSRSQAFSTLKLYFSHSLGHYPLSVRGSHDTLC